MAQILSIYGLVASVIITGGLIEKMSLHTGFLQLGAGLSVGLCGLAAGFAIGIIGDAGGSSSIPWRYQTISFPCSIKIGRPISSLKCRKLYLLYTDTWTIISSQSKHTAASSIRCYGVDPDFRRGLGIVRCHCVDTDAHKIYG